MEEKEEEINELLLQQLEKERNSITNKINQTQQEKQETKYKAHTYKKIIIILAIITFIGGIVLGNTYKITTLKDYYKDTTLPLKEYMYETTFNTKLMYSIWASDIVFSLFMLLLCDILKTQEQIKEKLK